MKSTSARHNNEVPAEHSGDADPVNQALVAALRTTRETLELSQQLVSAQPLDSRAEILASDGRGNGTVPAGIESYSRPRGMPSDAIAPKIAGIADEFTTSCLQVACDYVSVSHGNWREQLQAESPDLLFVESAWNGNQGQWRNKIHKLSPELLDLLKHCRAHQIPTVFWNKEDPVHYNSFVSTASQFDYVFTTDIGSISRYKTQLGHQRVHLMPFFAEPRIHTPVDTMPRRYDVTFAGAYYHNYPDRARDFDDIVGAIKASKSIRVYDRNWDADEDTFAFPEEYSDIVGPGVPYSNIEEAYKSGLFGLNLNSVKSSQSMFARRVFDLICSYTHVISNHSPALDLFFGDLVMSSDEGPAVVSHMDCLQAATDGHPPGTLSKYVRSRALRKVLDEHTTQNRLEYIYRVVLGLRQSAPPKVGLIAPVSSMDEIEQAVLSFRSQRYPNKRLLLVGARDLLIEISLEMPLPTGVEVHVDEELVGDYLQSCDWVGLQHPSNYYGPDYVTDLVNTSHYSDAPIATKRQIRIGSQAPGTTVAGLNGFDYVSACSRYSSLVRAELVETRQSWKELTAPGATWTDVNGLILRTDEFEFGVDSRTDPWQALHRLVPDQGASIDRVRERADGLHAVKSAIPTDALGDDAVDVATYFRLGDHARGKITLEAAVGGLQLDSTMEAEEHAYVYATQRIDDLPSVLRDGELPITIVASAGLQVSGVALFIDDNGDRHGSRVFPTNQGTAVSVPAGTRRIHLGLRLQGAGSSTVSSIHLREFDPSAPLRSWMSDNSVLTLTNVYPSRDQLYRNGFIHRRLKSYQQGGLNSDVFCLGRTENADSYNFNGINVIKGGKQRLRSMLKDNPYKAVLVHFLDEAMWEVLREFVPRLKVLVWVHGAEVQPWHRRSFNYESDEERAKAVEVSNLRTRFWSEFFETMHPNIHLVFVSRYFAHEVMDDNNVQLDDRQYSIIHNVIDVDLFQYQPKPVEQRYSVLSIRPYASRKYANDLSVEAVKILSRDHNFDRYNFTFVGDGPLFDEVLRPIRDLPNVHIERGFLSQSEIADVHKDYGLFLCPTRMDSQGVSKDEAMSSGLVPITTDITAIPEFVDPSCGWLAPPESASGLAEGIRTMADDEELFSRLSHAAAVRVRRQSGPTQTISREIRLINQAILPADEIGD